MTAITPLSPPSSAVTAAKSTNTTQTPPSEQQTQPRPRTRRKAPKVRTGCLTCRARRVKCDETHPTCNKCQKFKVTCTYALSIEKSNYRVRQTASKFQPLVPKKLSQLSSSEVCIGKEVRAGPRFTDKNEARYFVYYCEGISKKIGGPFKSKLWVQLVPQAGEGTPFIGRAVIALGALSLSLSRSPNEREKNHQYALNQYGRALKGMRKSIKENPRDVRTALIGCLLVFCFESLQGHQAAASAHASSGSNLITAMCLSRCTPKAWRESELGEELYSAFSGLNLQSLLFSDASTSASQEFYKSGLNGAAASMPETFEDLEECRRYWHYIMRRNLHFCREVRDFFSISPGTYEENDDGRTKEKALKEERDGYVQQICRWEIASARLLCRLFTAQVEEGEEFLIACLLRIHAAMSIVLLTRAFKPPETEYDKFYEQFRTIVDLSERIHPLLVSEGEENGVFRFEIGILPALSQVTLLCREKEMRDRAIRLLAKSKGYKEGIWDADAAGAVGIWIRGVEEEGLSDGEEVGEEKRVSVLGCEMRVEEHWARVNIKGWNGKGREGVVKW
ncbi:hypothetical protein N431DRAFT_429799 [Stipitochalara longipes BDJ]|nr:hypothetical protein N431DRAFT_429799 [Stipitochalara longipes BDJ]